MRLKVLSTNKRKAVARELLANAYEDVEAAFKDVRDLVVNDNALTESHAVDGIKGKNGELVATHFELGHPQLGDSISALVRAVGTLRAVQELVSVERYVQEMAEDDPHKGYEIKEKL